MLHDQSPSYPLFVLIGNPPYPLCMPPRHIVQKMIFTDHFTPANTCPVHGVTTTNRASTTACTKRHKVPATCPALEYANERIHVPPQTLSRPLDTVDKYTDKHNRDDEERFKAGKQPRLDPTTIGPNVLN